MASDDPVNPPPPEFDEELKAEAERFEAMSAHAAVAPAAAVTATTVEQPAEEPALIPVHISELMRGFQAAVSAANRSIRAGDEQEEEGEDIELMVIRDLQVSIDAPVVQDYHGSDPIIMLPTVNGATNDSSRVSLQFSIVTVPRK